MNIYKLATFQPQFNIWTTNHIKAILLTVRNTRLTIPCLSYWSDGHFTNTNKLRTSAPFTNAD